MKSSEDEITLNGNLSNCKQGCKEKSINLLHCTFTEKFHADFDKFKLKSNKFPGLTR